MGQRATTTRREALALLAGASLCAALPRRSRAQEPRPFRIGFSQPATSAGLTAEALREMRRALETDAALAPLLAGEGYTGIGLFPSDEGQDLLRRIDSLEFDLVFAPASVFVRQVAGYRVILQVRRPGDLVNPRGGGALQRGLAFVSARSPLFAEPDAGPTRVAEILQSTPLGVPASQSLAGFTAPMLQLAERHGVTRHDGGLVWYPSSADVTKAVLAGLVDAGVCEAGIHEMVLRGAGIEQEAPRLRRILFQTNPLPVDPVLVRPTLDPEVSELGRELKRALRTLSFSQDFGELSLQSARDEDYAAVPEMLDRFARVLGTLRP